MSGTGAFLGQSLGREGEMADAERQVHAELAAPMNRKVFVLAVGGGASGESGG